MGECVKSKTQEPKHQKPPSFPLLCSRYSMDNNCSWHDSQNAVMIRCCHSKLPYKMCTRLASALLPCGLMLFALIADECSRIISQITKLGSDATTEIVIAKEDYWSAEMSCQAHSTRQSKVYPWEIERQTILTLQLRSSRSLQLPGFRCMSRTSFSL